MNEQPDDRLPGAVAGGPEAEGDVDSEPRRRWQPNPELLRALAETRKDLRPGESSLFWDWTRTRDSAPEAEDLGPSGEGEVLVSDKEAAAAYVPPKKVSPAARPRPWTKSRVRVREDVDPRRQPTVRSRGDGARTSDEGPASGDPSRAAAGPEASGGAHEPASRGDTLDGAASPREPASFPGLTPLAPGMFEQEDARRRGRRLAWAVPVGLVAATIVFLWLQSPVRGSAEGGPPVRAAAPQGPGAATGRDELREASGDSAPAGQDASGSARHGGARASIDPGQALATPGLAPEERASRSAAASTGTPAGTAHPGRPPQAPEAKPASSSAREAAPKVHPAQAAPPDDDGFLIRKKGDGPR